MIQNKIVCELCVAFKGDKVQYELTK